MNLNHILFFDIETVSGSAHYEDLDDRWKKLFAGKARYFQEREPHKEMAQLYRERAAIFAEFGRAVCIGAGFFHKDQLRIKTFAEPDEEILLQEFFDLLNQHFNQTDRHVLCGHNIREFDVPYLCRRAQVHGIPLPSLLDVSGRKPWEVKHLVDTMELWKFGDIKHYTSLDLLSACLGLESPKEDMDGSQVHDVFYESEDIERIARYCATDVWVTANVYLHLHRQPTIRLENVYFIDK